MVQARTAKGITLQAPTMGVNFKDPLAAMDKSFSPWMINFIAENRYCRLRQGMKNFATLTNGNYPNLLASYPGGHGADILFALGFDSSDSKYKAYDITAGGSIGPTTTIDYFNSLNKHFSNLFAGYLFFFESHSPTVGKMGAKYNGGWSAIDYTYVNVTYPIGAASYKGRQYIIDKNGFGYDYSDLNAVGGASLHGESLAGVFTKGGANSWIATFSTIDGVTNEVYLAFGSTSGEVLIYSGDYPGSSSWRLQAKFVIGRPIYAYPYAYTQVIERQGDALIITSTGLVSLRDLFTKGSNAALAFTVSSNIDDYWTKIVQQQQAGSVSLPWWSGVFFPEQNKIIIATNGFINKDNSLDSTKTTFFIFNTITGAWSVCTTANLEASVQGLVYMNNNIYLNVYTYSAYKYEGKTNYLDDLATNPSTEVAYTFDINGAWDSFGSEANMKKVTAFEALVYTDLNTAANSLKCAASADFGVSTSSYNDVVINSAQKGYQKIVYSVGAAGTYFQYQLTGTSRGTYGCNLYGINSIFEIGGLLS